MNSNIIKNIVFFNSNGITEACVFNTDGTSKKITGDEGYSLLREIANENGIKTAKEFKKVFAAMVNKKLVHVVSKKEFEEKYETYKAEPKTFKKAKAKKRFGVGAKVGAIAMSAIMAVSGVTFALTKHSKTGNMLKMNMSGTTTELNDEEKDPEDNNFYDSYTFEELQEVTKNQTQKAEMKRIHDALYGYNIDFAKNYLEEGKDIRAALTFREVVALSQAYNKFSPEEIKAIFNGQAITAAELDSAYKSATLQLMGAHVIETKEHPVDMSGIIVSEEGKEFYDKYHSLFLNAKEATGDEKITAVEAFYAEVRNDFPINPDDREIGISHASAHAEVEAYKLSVVPMIAAGEIMWQNLDIDETLQGGINAYFFGNVDLTELSNEELVDIILNGNVGVAKGEIDYFNDMGLCNQAADRFEMVQQITMGAISNSDKTNPRFDQYENAMVKELTDFDAYVIDDAHRDLSALDRFQEEVNWHFEIDEYGYYTGSVYYTTETHTRTRTWTETKTETRTEETREEKEITDEAKEEVDKELEEENEKSEEEGKKEAEENQQEMQEEEDKKAEEIQEEIKQDEEDMQDKIEDANDKIEENQEISKENEDKPADEQKPVDPVNEEDFGDHNVVFEDEHKDEEGNLNDSVEHITTDDSDVKTEDDLPDPNETGAKFDEEGEKQASNESKPKAAAPAAPSKPEPAPAPAPAQTSAPSNEKAVDAYVEDLANSSDEDEDAKELQK